MHPLCSPWKYCGGEPHWCRNEERSCVCKGGKEVTHRQATNQARLPSSTISSTTYRNVSRAPLHCPYCNYFLKYRPWRHRTHSTFSVETQDITRARVFRRCLQQKCKQRWRGHWKLRIRQPAIYLTIYSHLDLYSVVEKTCLYPPITCPNKLRLPEATRSCSTILRGSQK
jgi:hypothetical protein